MAWEFIKRFFGKKSRGASDVAEVRWLQPGETTWDVPVLDVRPVTLGTTSWSPDRESAENAISFGKEDGTAFLGQQPEVRRTTRASLRFPVDGKLVDGVLFGPSEMEHKWAIFYHQRRIICVRSWTRRVTAVATVEERADHIEVTSIDGTLVTKDEEPAFTVRVLDYLLRSHVLNLVYPAPIPVGLETDPKQAAIWCMNAFGKLAWVATPHLLRRDDPGKPLRVNSLLHIAAARGDLAAVEAQLAAGVPIELLANDGLAPLHWSMARPDLATAELLLKKGSPVDVRSAEGATPLMNAVQGTDVDKAVFLLDRGADPNAVDHRGFTALHRAAEIGSTDLVRLLLDRGAHAKPEADGHTPKSLAAAHGHRAIAALLEDLT